MVKVICPALINSVGSEQAGPAHFPEMHNLKPLYARRFK